MSILWGERLIRWWRGAQMPVTYLSFGMDTKQLISWDHFFIVQQAVWSDLLFGCPESDFYQSKRWVRRKAKNVLFVQKTRRLVNDQP